MEEERSAFKILIGKPSGKRFLGSPKRRWEDNITMVLKEIGINTSIGLIWLGIGIIESPCECPHLTLGSIGHGVS